MNEPKVGSQVLIPARVVGVNGSLVRVEVANQHGRLQIDLAAKELRPLVTVPEKKNEPVPG